MLKICKYCGAKYEGDPGGSCCPDCARQQRVTTLRERVCRTCGVTFTGGPRAWYCPECRRERQLEQDRAYKRNGPARKIGSIDLCSICGKPYTVSSGLQKYCPACAPDAVREIDREQSRAWNAAHTTPEGRKVIRKAASAQIPCVVCGRLFVPVDASITCSKECSRKLAKTNDAKWTSAHREELNAARRQRNARHIGDTDICYRCGKAYTISNGRQKYCPECSEYQKKGNNDE